MKKKDLLETKIKIFKAIAKSSGNISTIFKQIEKEKPEIIDKDIKKSRCS